MAKRQTLSSEIWALKDVPLYLKSITELLRPLIITGTLSAIGEVTEMTIPDETTQVLPAVLVHDRNSVSDVTTMAPAPENRTQSGD